MKTRYFEKSIYEYSLILTLSQQISETDKSDCTIVSNVKKNYKIDFASTGLNFKI